ncbi:hypothetical protein HPB48_011256 [Haemaphysalis longicornis]|uniref:C2H2-type domain-containing protein n=1 Tax=Haemaphysalis longicornis TaxID=44386 RepID=A0A9J6H2N7_HAELO|nr:hypothetical protein HPB48_011256 [Haemaphysalis longicornis]
MLHTCPRCGFSSRKLSKIVWHIRDHRNERGFRVMCGVGGCPATYSCFESFRKHLYREHRSHMDLAPSRKSSNAGRHDNVGSSEEARVRHDNVGPSEEARVRHISNDAEPLSEDYVMSDADESERVDPRTSTSTHDFKEKLRKQLCLLFFRVAEGNKLPHSTTEKIFDDFKVTFVDVLRLWALEIQQRIAVAPDENTELQTLLACDFIDDVFQGVKSKYQREQFAKAHLPYVKPEEQVLSDGKTFQYVPIISVLRNLMSSKSFCNSLDPSMEAAEESPLLRSFCDGLIYEEKVSALLENGSQYTLFLVLYSDEVDVVNPLGSKRGVHKLLVVYFSVLNLHVRYRSQLCTIHVAVVARYKLVQEHGIGALLKPLISDVSTLATDGFVVESSGVNVKVSALVVAISGDNLSMNRLGGFTCCFSKGRPCRYCTAAFPKFASIFHEKDVHVRNAGVHRTHVDSAIVNKPLSTVLYGVTSESPLSSIGYFDVTMQLPPDIMHDLLEGSIPHVLREVLQGLITSKVITVPDLDKVAAFDYGSHDKKNKPEPLEKTFVTARKPYKGTASQKWCLFRFFSLIFGDLVPEENEHWDVYLGLRKVVDLVFADELPRDHLPYLQDEIRFFVFFH